VIKNAAHELRHLTDRVRLLQIIDAFRQSGLHAGVGGVITAGEDDFAVGFIPDLIGMPPEPGRGDLVVWLSA
jgi:hypothetical protein